LWHAGPEAKAQGPVDLLYRTGFLPSSNRRSLQSRSSVLGSTNAGRHVPRIHDKALRPAQYQREIIAGFRRAWRCVLGTRNRRAAFVRRLGRICSKKRRRIYWPTEKYAAIIRASVQPGALRSGVERDLMLSRLCSRTTVTPAVVHAEITSLRQLDIPYFTSGTNARFPLDTVSTPPAELTSALRDAL
jgi:lantibiotic modifying enzyme